MKLLLSLPKHSKMEQIVRSSAVHMRTPADMHSFNLYVKVPNSKTYE
jgi:hypothetical protein